MQSAPARLACLLATWRGLYHCNSSGACYQPACCIKDGTVGWYITTIKESYSCDCSIYDLCRLRFRTDHTTEVYFILRKTWLRRIQAGPGRTIQLQQEQTSPNLERIIESISIFNLYREPSIRKINWPEMVPLAPFGSCTKGHLHCLSLPQPSSVLFNECDVLDIALLDWNFSFWSSHGVSKLAWFPSPSTSSAGRINIILGSCWMNLNHERRAVEGKRGGVEEDEEETGLLILPEGTGDWHPLHITLSSAIR